MRISNESTPRPNHALDKQIAAIALVNSLTIVTRNTAGFDGTGVKLKNPFQ
jgi:toxin FitB